MHRLIQALMKETEPESEISKHEYEKTKKENEAAQIRKQENEKMGSLTLAFSSAFMRTNSFLL